MRATSDTCCRRPLLATALRHIRVSCQRSQVLTQRLDGEVRVRVHKRGSGRSCGIDGREAGDSLLRGRAPNVEAVTQRLDEAALGRVDDSVYQPVLDDVDDVRMPLFET